MSTRVDRSSEAGASLVLVLVTLVVFGLLVPVLGQFGTANGVSGYIVKGQRYDRYAADNAVQSAIAYAQTRRTAGRAYVPCPDLRSVMNETSTAFRRDVTVKCRGFDASGVPVGDAARGIPAYAVLGLNGGRHSIDVDSGGPGTIKTQGAWWANGDPGETSADIHGVTIDASEDLFGATGRCRPSEGARIIAAPNRCLSRETVSDPGFGSGLDTLDGTRADPFVETRGCLRVDRRQWCCRPRTRHPLEHRLAERTHRRLVSADVAIWLKPGVHYFDFDFYDRAKRGSGDSRWRIGDSGDQHVTLVAGERSGWTTEPEAYAAATQANEAAGAGACDLGVPGAELVLGSNSNIRIESPARVELCPWVVEGAGQRLSVSGAPAGPAERVESFGPVAPREAVGDGNISWPSSPPESIDPITEQNCNRNDDCGPVNVNYAAGDLSRDATVTMKVPNPFRANARLETLQLDVSHRETENRDGDDEDNRVRIRRLWLEVTGLGIPIECDDLPASINIWSQRTVNCDVSEARFPLPAVDGPDGLADLNVVLHVETRGGRRGSITVALDSVGLKGTQTPVVSRSSACDCDAIYFDNERERQRGVGIRLGHGQPPLRHRASRPRRESGLPARTGCRGRHVSARQLAARCPRDSIHSGVVAGRRYLHDSAGDLRGDHRRPGQIAGESGVPRPGPGARRHPEDHRLEHPPVAPP